MKWLIILNLVNFKYMLEIFKIVGIDKNFRFDINKSPFPKNYPCLIDKNSYYDKLLNEFQEYCYLSRG